MFNGSNVSEKISISANHGRVSLVRDVGNVTMDLNGVEHIQLNALGGADNITVNDLSGTGVTQVAIDLASPPSSGMGDLAADTVTVNATKGDDVIAVQGQGGSLTVAGLPEVVTISGSEATDALTVAGAGLYSDFQRLGMRDCAFAVASGARCQILSGTVAAGACHIKFHPSAGLGDLAGAVALGAFSWRFDRAVAVAVAAGVVARNVEAHHAAADRRPERNVDLILQVCSGFGAFFGGRGAMAATEDGTEDVAEAAPACPAAAFAAASGVVDEVRKIEAAEIEVNALAAIWLAAGESTAS